MPNRYHCSGEGDCSPAGLDELLCEYVDGTMDPVVRSVFEELLRRDACLAQQAERLRTTRHLLCRHGCQMQAPSGLQARVRHRLACEMMQAQQPFLAGAVDRLGTAALAASAVALTLLVGMLVGMTVLSDRSDAIAVQSATRAIPAWHTPGSLGHLRAPMTPLPERPLRKPWFAGQPALPQMQTGYLPGSVPPAALQRTGAAP